MPQSPPFKRTLRLLALLLFSFTGANAVALEEPTYEVLLTVGDIEFRRYDPYMLAEVTVEGDSRDRRAFRILAGYIFGDNDDSVKMNMTAPVETRGNDYAFVMESKYSLESLPRPNDERIRIVEREQRVVAVLPFSGRWTERNIGSREQQLVAALTTMGVRMTGAPELARYNGPLTPWFLRRNEIIVPVDWKSVQPEEIIATDPRGRL